MSNELLLGQFISYLLHDLRRAANLAYQGRFYDAVTVQIYTIGELYYADDKEREKLVEWEKKYDAIPIMVQNIRGTDPTETKFLKLRRMNRLGKPLYREIHKDVWAKLHDMNYFRIEKWKPKTKRDTMFDELA